MSDLLDKGRVEIKLGEYGTAPATALSDGSLLPRVQEYRRLSGSRMVPLDAEEIVKRIPKAEYHVSRKVDGEFTVLIARDGECLSLNPGGTVRVGLPWQAEAARLLAKAGVDRALIAGELYVYNEARRERVHDVTTVARQPQSKEDLQRLRLAVFDIVAIDDERNERPFAETWRLIQKWFAGGELVHPVEAVAAGGADDVKKQFEKWVEQQGAEGLVVRSDTAGTFKVKPRHNLDAVVVGFTESVEDRQGMLHDLLLAVMRRDGALQVLTRVGGGFSEDQRRSMLSDLKDMVVESEYAEVNSDHVAYQMVRPEWVAEISCLDLISQTTRGGPVNRMVLNFRDNGSTKYETVRRLPLAAVISPQFVRLREDKSAQPHDVRIEQVSGRVEVPLVERDARQMTLPQSELLRRDVYVKEAKGETMVRKFVVIQTNKQTESDEHPAYVLHYTDFSPNRKDPLAREVRVSNSLEQISALCDEMIEANIKKGWSLHGAFAAESMPQPATPIEVSSEKVPAEKKPAKKASTKKATKPKMAPSTSTRKKTSKKKSG
ncbi:MAG: hypothetical protein RIC55_25625 [Pirellulaceae bacterium]